MNRTRVLVPRVLAVSGWLSFLYMTWFALTDGAALTVGGVFQVDWHVYWAGARDLMDRDLYRVPLDAGGLPLSTKAFNLPPLSAAWALPLLGLPTALAGYVWQVVAASAIATAGIIALEILSVPRPWLWAGLVLGPLAFTLLYLEGLHLATNNYLMLGLVAVGSWFYIRGRDTTAGMLFGLAIATKLWPAVLLVVATRERRWRVIGWALAVTLVQGAVLFGWLGVDAMGLLLANLWTPIPPTGLLVGPTAITGLRDVWNSGLGVVVALVLLVLPLRGRMAVGAAILAGMAPISNLWIHYAPTLLFGFALLLPVPSGWVSLRSGRGLTRDQRPITEEPPS